MPRFAIINPKEKSVTALEAKDYQTAVGAAGLRLDELDFGTVASFKDGSSLSIIVYEYGLLEGDESDYFALNGRLYNGYAVLFTANEEGETTDLSANLIQHLNMGCPMLLWFNDISEAEEAIAKNKVIRPQSSINGMVFWSWNQTEKAI